MLNWLQVNFTNETFAEDKHKIMLTWSKF